MVLDTEWTQDCIEENHFVNRVRERVKQWRIGGYIGVTSITKLAVRSEEGKVLSYEARPLIQKRMETLSKGDSVVLLVINPNWLVSVGREKDRAERGCAAGHQRDRDFAQRNPTVAVR